MRTLIAATLLLAVAAPAAAATREFERRPSPECPLPRALQAKGSPQRAVQPLGTMPAAWRLHAVDRRVTGCPVAPEARRVSDRAARAPARQAPPAR